MRSPVSTPGGIFTDRVRVRRTRPWPRQVSQGLRTSVPVPRQRGQVCCSWKKPWLTRTWPWPPQVSQVVGAEPLAEPVPWQVSHSDRRATSISTWWPKTACASSSSSS